MKTTINTNKSPYIFHKNRKNDLNIFLIYLVWVVSCLFLYRIIFTRYGLINNIIMNNQIDEQEIIIKNLTDERDLIKHKIYLINNNDIDLLEELSIQMLNKIPSNAKILFDE